MGLNMTHKVALMADVKNATNLQCKKASKSLTFRERDQGVLVEE